MKKLVATAMLGATLMASASKAESYHLVAKVDFGITFVDSETIRTQGDRVQFWSTMFLFEDGDGRVVSPQTAFMLDHEEIDCSKELTHHLGLQSYDAHGMPTVSVQDPTPWTAIIPGSNQAIKAKLTCDRVFLASDPGFRSEALAMLKTVRQLRSKFQ